MFSIRYSWASRWELQRLTAKKQQRQMGPATQPSLRGGTGARTLSLRGAARPSTGQALASCVYAAESCVVQGRRWRRGVPN